MSLSEFGPQGALIPFVEVSKNFLYLILFIQNDIGLIGTTNRRQL
jgi:hypothetical protein